MAAQYNVGDFVIFQGNMCVIDGIHQPLGSYHTFRLSDAVNGRVYYASKQEISHCELAEVVDFDVSFEAETTVPLKNNKPPSRFVKVAEQDIRNLADSRLEKSTKKQSAWAVKILREWLTESGLDPNFEWLEKEALNEILRAFYAAVRSADGQVYLKPSMINLRSGIKRHLVCQGRVIDLVHDADFTQANLVFSGVLKKLRKDGLDFTKHKKPVATEDMMKLYSSGVLSCEDPCALQNKVFVELSLHFARRGREGLRDLRKDSFRVMRDAGGREYICMAYNEKEKNHQGGDVSSIKSSEKEAVMYAVDNDELCPVKSFKLYLGKLHPECDAFFQTPNKNFKKSGVWYKKCPVGINTIGSKMSDLSKRAELSVVYTNHCLRATSATVLSHSGAEGREIIAFTGHKQESSLRPYVAGPSDSRKREMSDILHDFGKAAKADGADAPQADAVPSVNHAPAPPSAALGAPGSSPADGRPTTAPLVPHITGVPVDPEAHIATEAPVICGAGPVVNNVNVNGLTMASGQLMQGAFYGASFHGPTTINFNFNQ